jgi:hypothetical protein
MCIPQFARNERARACSAGSRERMTSEESRQTRRHRAWIRHVQQAPRVGEDESLDLRQPVEQKFLTLAEDWRDLSTLCAQDGEGGLFDADRIFPRTSSISPRNKASSIPCTSRQPRSSMSRISSFIAFPTDSSAAFVLLGSSSASCPFQPSRHRPAELPADYPTPWPLIDTVTGDCAWSVGVITILAEWAPAVTGRNWTDRLWKAPAFS